MKIFKLKDMVRGWFVGNFEPSCLKTNAVEVGVKTYKQGDYEERHHHRIATEITLIVKGKVKMNEKIYTTGDIIIIEPNESTDFLALTNTINVVVKIPGTQNDKYLGDIND